MGHLACEHPQKAMGGVWSMSVPCKASHDDLTDCFSSFSAMKWDNSVYWDLHIESLCGFDPEL